MAKKAQYTETTQAILKAIKDIPYGKVDTYGRVAARAGLPSGARQVARILHALSEKEQLPWHRVVNSKLQISLKGEPAMIQRLLLEEEGIVFVKGTVPLRALF